MGTDLKGHPVNPFYHVFYPLPLSFYAPAVLIFQKVTNYGQRREIGSMERRVEGGGREQFPGGIVLLRSPMKRRGQFISLLECENTERL